MIKNIRFILSGFLFGIILIKAEVVSWFRIQEMFYFQSIHMYGIIGLAILVGFLSVMVIRRFNIKAVNGEQINTEGKPFMKYANLLGGIIFGLGWSITGACPGPIYVLIGNGLYVFIFVLLAAYAGAFVYGILKKHLPH